MFSFLISYSATITVPAPLTALMSAVPVGAAGAPLPPALAAAAAADAASPHGAAAVAAAAYGGAPSRCFHFTQAVPIAPYLIALVR